MRRSLIAVTLLLLTPLASAQVYKWTDAAGTVHYSEMPPAQGTAYRQVKTNGAQPASAPAPAANTEPVSKSEPAPAPAPAQPVADTPENRGKLCDSLKANLAALQATAPVVMQQDGKPVVLDPAQRQQQTTASQAQYQQYCQTK